MAGSVRDQAIADARSVGSAAGVLARALKEGSGREADAADQLELQGTLAVEESIAGFASAEKEETSDEDLLAASVSQFGIGLTLISAEAAMSPDGRADQLDQAILLLERNADDIEAGGAKPGAPDHFDTQPGGVMLRPHAAAIAALEEMAGAAAEVATSVLDKALKPLIDKVPAELSDLVAKLEIDVGGRIARLGLKAVRRGFYLLLTLVDVDVIERARDRVDSVLTRLVLQP